MTVYELFKGKTINFIGDSLLGGHTLGLDPVWCRLLADKNDMQHINYGSNGSTMSDCKGGAKAIVKRYVEMADNDPDIVVFEGGRNDYNKCAVIDDGTEDETTYCGALITLVKGFRKKYPRAVLIGVTFWKVNDVPNKEGVSCNEYTRAMMRTLDELGVAYVDATDTSKCPIDMTDRENRVKYCLEGPGDVCHLNVQGFKDVMVFFEAEIAKIYANAMGVTLD